MQSELVGFRYATSRWLALSGLSLISFFLIFKDLPLLRTLFVRFYRRKNQQHIISTHAYIIPTQDMQHTTQSLIIRNKHVQISESITIFTKEYTTLIIAKQFLMEIKPYSQANNLQASD
jgi:hypothetical protein